jgi:hypothetical protein
MIGSKSNYILESVNGLNNESSVLESFFQIFDMWVLCKKLQFQKAIN